jgi:hypothetical protein
MVHRNRANVHEFGQIIFIWDLSKRLVTVQRLEGESRGKETYVISMPSNHIEWTVVLGALEELSTELINNLPGLLGNFIMGNGAQEVPCISQPIGAQRPELWKLEAGSPDLENISSRRAIRQLHAEAKTTLNDNKLPRLDIEFTEFSLNVQCTLLRDDQKLAIGVDEGLLCHARVGRVHVCCDTLTESGVSGASNGLETGHEVNLTCLWDVKGVPSQLGGGDMDPRVQREKVRLRVCVVWHFGLGMLVFVDRNGCYTYKTLVCNCRTGTVQPCLLVGVSWSHKGSCGDLLCVQTKAHITGVVLAMWNSARNCFRFKSEELHQPVESLDAGECEYIRVAESGLILVDVSQSIMIKDELVSYLVRVIVPCAERGDCSIFLRLGPMEYLLIFRGV